MTVAFLALGSNINPEKNILDAARLLAEHVKIIKSSKIYITEPLQGRVQTEYWNCVLKIETDIEPSRLKQEVLRSIESELGRTRTLDKYASRTMDIDLILYEDLQVRTDDMIIPDPAIRERAFLAVPLCEVQPDLAMPDTKEAICEIAKKLGTKGMTELKEATKALEQLINRLGVQEP